MTVKDAAKELKLDWHAGKALDKEYMQEQLRRNLVAAPRATGIDELSFLKSFSATPYRGTFLRRRIS